MHFHWGISLENSFKPLTKREVEQLEIECGQANAAYEMVEFLMKLGMIPWPRGHMNDIANEFFERQL